MLLSQFQRTDLFTMGAVRAFGGFSYRREKLCLGDQNTGTSRSGRTNALSSPSSGLRDAAKAMGVLSEVVTIEVGKTADLVLLDADPLTKIPNTRKIDAVVLRGRLFSRDELSAMRNH